MLKLPRDAVRATRGPRDSSCPGAGAQPGCPKAQDYPELDDGHSCCILIYKSSQQQGCMSLPDRRRGLWHSWLPHCHSQATVAFNNTHVCWTYVSHQSSCHTQPGRAHFCCPSVNQAWSSHRCPCALDLHMHMHTHVHEHTLTDPSSITILCLIATLRAFQAL